jgi:hypothetical protein
MSREKRLGRLYNLLTPEERFRLDVLALARGDEEESERLTTTCPRSTYTMYDREFIDRLEAAQKLAMLAYMDVVSPLDKIKVLAAFRETFSSLRMIRQDDLLSAYLDGHEAGRRYAWEKSGNAGEPPGCEADEEEAERNADPSTDEALQKWTGHCEELDARFERMLEGIERKLVRKALTVWSGFAGFCSKELGLEAGKLVEALARPFAERVPELEELSARYEVEPEVEGVEEYVAILTEAWRRAVEAA